MRPRPAGQNDQTGHRAHDGCCSVCSVLQTGAPVDVPQTADAISFDRAPERVVWVEFTPDRNRLPRRLARAGARATGHFLTDTRDRRGLFRAGRVQLSRPADAPVSGPFHVSLSCPWRRERRRNSGRRYLRRPALPMRRTVKKKPCRPSRSMRRAAAKRAVRKPANRTAAVRRQTQPAAAAPERQLPVVVVDTPGAGANASLGTPPAVARFQLPQQSFSITAKQIDETINLKDPEDAVKYMPSLFVRKRNDGDNQAVLATRSWGLNSSARTLIYYDDLLISALIGNNNSGASPNWNLISPEAIGRVDFLNGPFAAAYPGNSIGGVLLITSKMPDKPFAVAKETVSVMPWNQYGTKDTYVTQPDQRGRGQSRRPAVVARQRQLSRQLSAAADLHDQRRIGPPGESDRERFRR